MIEWMSYNSFMTSYSLCSLNCYFRSAISRRIHDQVSSRRTVVHSFVDMYGLSSSPFLLLKSYVVKEKELRQKELMKMMGVSESDIGLSWFLTFLVLHVITATLAAILSARLYSNSSFEVLWLFWMLTVTSIVVFCMTVASLTAKTIRAVLIGLLVFFAGVFLTYTFDYREDSAALIQLISVHPVAAFSYGLNQIGHLEDKGIGLTIDTIRYDENPSGYSFSHTINMLLIDCFVWSFLAWYLNRVVKPDYGQALPCYFPFTSAYWCANHSQGPLSETSVCDKMARTNIPYEPVSDGLMRQTAEGKSIEIHDLRKVFGEKCAVDSLNLSMYSGQITALLGHNGMYFFWIVSGNGTALLRDYKLKLFLCLRCLGAGKTTTINMLTGAMGPTEGYATIVGKDIRTDLRVIRQDIGICLQHDCLFPDLTVREHVQFFARLKGLYDNVSIELAESQIDQSITDVALFEKRNSASKSLSGGMKRKLSVAIAFCGNSKVVLLDEPTSGMVSTNFYLLL